MKAFAVVIALLIGALGLAPNGGELEKVSERRFVELLANSEVLAEWARQPYHLKVIRLRPPGECNGEPMTCPQETLFIVASTFDEAPDQGVYRSLEAHRWEFLRWVVFPEVDGPNFSAVFEVRGKTVRSEGKGAVETWKTFEVRVNPWRASMTERAP